MIKSFGPWATAASAGSKAHLSTFWKRRLAMLRAAHLSKSRLGGRAVLLLLTAAGLIAALPTLHGAAATAPAAKDSAQPTDAPHAKRPGTEKPDLRHTLRYDGKSFDQWQAELQTELKTERRIEAIRALEAFGRAGLAEEAAAAIKNALDQEAEQGQLSNSGYRALANLGPSGVAPLLDGLKSDRASIRSAAAEAWSSNSAKARAPEPVVAALIEATRDPDASVREQASGSLASIARIQKEHAGRVVQALVNRLDDEDFRVRTRAIERLGSLKAEAAVPALIKFIEGRLNTRSKEETGRMEWHSELQSAIRALGNVGTAAKSAIPVLERLTTDSDPEFKTSTSQGPPLSFQASNALRKISPSGTASGARPAPAAPAKSQPKATKP